MSSEPPLMVGRMQFTLREIMITVSLYAVLFSVLQSVGSCPAAYSYYGSLFGAIGVGDKFFRTRWWPSFGGLVGGFFCGAGSLIRCLFLQPVYPQPFALALQIGGAVVAATVSWFFGCAIMIVIAWIIRFPYWFFSHRGPLGSSRKVAQTDDESLAPVSPEQAENERRLTWGILFILLIVFCISCFGMGSDGFNFVRP